MANVYGPFQANKIQMGREATAGTAVPATVIWRGEFASLEDARTREIVDEQVGLIINAERSYDSRYEANCSFPATPMTFAQLPHIFEAGCQTVSPADASPKYTYSYAYPVSNTANTIKTYTIEAYNVIADDDYREMEYAHVSDFSLSMNSGESWMMSSNWVGRQLSTGSPTSLTTLLAVEEALAMKTSLKIDTLGSIGTTPVPGVLVGATIDVTTGFVPVWVGDGQLYYATVKEHAPEITFSLTLELMEATGVSVVNAERVLYEANTGRAFEITIAGSDANHSIVFEFGGKYDSIGTYTNSDGNTTVTFEGHAIYSSSDSLYFNATIANLLSSL